MRQVLGHLHGMRLQALVYIPKGRRRLISFGNRIRVLRRSIDAQEEVASPSHSTVDTSSGRIDPCIIILTADSNHSPRAAAEQIRPITLTLEFELLGV